MDSRTMRLDNFDVVIGDQVYDLVFGYGTVTDFISDDEDKMIVRFGEHRRITYDGSGFGQFNARTLFWHNPIAAIPAKNNKAWDLQRSICLDVVEKINRYMEVLGNE